MSNQTPQDQTSNQPLANQTAALNSASTLQDNGDALSALEKLIKQSQQRVGDQPATEKSAENNQSDSVAEEAQSDEVQSDEMNKIAALKQQKEQETLERLEQHKLEMQAMVEESPQTAERAKSKQEKKEIGQRDLDNSKTKIKQLSHTVVKTLKD